MIVVRFFTANQSVAKGTSLVQDEILHGQQLVCHKPFILLAYIGEDATGIDSVIVLGMQNRCDNQDRHHLIRSG